MTQLSVSGCQVKSTVFKESRKNSQLFQFASVGGGRQVDYPMKIGMLGLGLENVGSVGICFMKYDVWAQALVRLVQYLILKPSQAVEK